MNKLLLTISLFSILISCGEEAITQQTVSEEYTASSVDTFELSECAHFTFRKPPVDILYVVDNTGSTLSNAFESIKSEIKNTVSTLSSDFDYHIYVAPLIPNSDDSISGYPIIISDTSSVPSIASLSQVNVESLSMFSEEKGNNIENGFERVKNLIEGNRSNGIFRDEANTIIIMISNGDDSSVYTKYGENVTYNSAKFTEHKTNMVNLKTSLDAASFRFISLVPFTECNDSWKVGLHYQKMSEYIYGLEGYTDSSSQDKLDLCSGDYSSLFTAINNSIQAVVDGHKYDHWVISTASEAEIEASDITLTKVSTDGTISNIEESTTDGFEYLGYKEDQLLNYEPTDVVEKGSGLIVKLYGSARVTHPECLIAKTRTPTEYFGYISLPREPNTSTIKITIDGTDISESTTDGWNYIGWKDTQNIKVPGPTDAAITPEVTKSGYMIQLSGNAIFTNGQSVKVYYKPNSL